MQKTLHRLFTDLRLGSKPLDFSVRSGLFKRVKSSNDFNRKDSKYVTTGY